MSDKYHGSITVFPDGSIYAGEVEEAIPSNGGLIAVIKKEAPQQRGLAAKVDTTPRDGKIAALYAKIMYDRHQLSLKGATTIANSENITHLQLIRLFESAQGVPDVYFHIDEMYVKRDIPQLEFRETFYDTTQTAQYLDRLEETDVTKTNYDEIKYDLKKLTDKVYTPIEDILRTIINPQEVDLDQIEWGMKRKRNQEGINQLADIENTQSSLGSPADIGSNFHSTNNTGNELTDLFRQFLIANDVSITHIAMSPKMYADYTSNTWTENGGPNGITAQRLPSGGVVQMSGLSGITAVVDPMITNDLVMYAINKPNALRLGEGPKIMRRYKDEERDADAIKKLDFNQYLAVNAQLTKLTRDFGMTIPFDAPA